jgi:phosphinothricin N-acetyltransferase
MHKKEENWKYDESKKFKDIKSENIKIRDVLPEDAERIQEIYSPYVSDTVISFEITVPDKSEMKKRIKKLLANAFPYIVAENETGTVVGYAYADKFGEREAYRYSFIVSIYLDMEVQSKGIGQKLYDELEKRMKKMGIVQVLSAITGKNEKSLKFHEKNGFTKIGHFPNVGYKMGEWHDIIWMNKTINSIEEVQNRKK